MGAKVERNFQPALICMRAKARRWEPNMKYGIQSERYRNLIIIFTIGFMIGIFLMNISQEFFLSDDGILNLSTISRLKYIEVDNSSFLYYVSKERVKIILLLCLLATTYVGIASVYCFILWQGFMVGMFFTAAIIRYGLKGILLLCIGLLPQQLLLVPAWILLSNWCCQICCKIYFPYKMSESENYIKSHYFLRKGLSLLWIILVVIIGCILECYVNPILVFEFFSFF